MAELMKALFFQKDLEQAWLSGLQSMSKHLGPDSVIDLVKTTVAPEITKKLFNNNVEDIPTLVQIVIQLGKICHNNQELVYLCLPTTDESQSIENVDLLFVTTFLEPRLNCFNSDQVQLPKLWPESAITFLTKVS